MPPPTPSNMLWTNILTRTETSSWKQGCQSHLLKGEVAKQGQLTTGCKVHFCFVVNPNPCQEGANKAQNLRDT